MTNTITYRATRVTYDDEGKRLFATPRDVRSGMTMEQVVTLTQCGPDEIRWAIEEYGHFEVLVDASAMDYWLVEEETIVE